MSLNGYDKNIVTYQQLLLTMCCSVMLLYLFFYIQKVDMLDFEEFSYVCHPEVAEYT